MTHPFRKYREVHGKALEKQNMAVDMASIATSRVKALEAAKERFRRACERANEIDRLLAHRHGASVPEPEAIRAIAPMASTLNWLAVDAARMAGKPSPPRAKRFTDIIAQLSKRFPGLAGGEIERIVKASARMNNKAVSSWRSRWPNGIC